jgi:hypothetical protein
MNGIQYQDGDNAARMTPDSRKSAIGLAHRRDES